jgi:type I restriction enzyme S subunit
MTSESPQTLDDVCEFIVDCLHKTAPLEDEGYPSIRTPNVGRGRLLLDGVNRVSADTYAEWTRRAVPREADLILAREAPAGNVAIIKEGQTVCLGQRTVHLRPDATKVDPDFLCYFLLAPPQQGALLAGETGATAAHVNMRDIRRLPLHNMPPLQTQRRIGAVLAAYDDLIENNRRRIVLLQNVVEQLYREWFVRLSFPGHELTPIKDGVPEKWSRTPLAELCESIDYGFTASADQEEIGPKYLRITDIVPSTIDWSSVPYCEIPDERIDRFLLREGDIVVARTGATVGYAKRLHKRHLKSVFASYLVRLRLKPGIDNIMIGVFVESDSYKRYVQSRIGGAAQPNASAPVLAAAEVLVPTEPLQHRFRAIAEPVLDERELLEMQNRTLIHARDLLLPRLTSGEIAV